MTAHDSQLEKRVISHPVYYKKTVMEVVIYQRGEFGLPRPVSKY